MSQTSDSLAPANGSGATVRAAIGTDLQAIYSLQSGSSPPSYTVAGGFWLDTSSSPYVLKQRNTANSGWTTHGSINSPLWGALPAAGGAMTGAVSDAKGANVASANTCDIWTPADGNMLHITGSTQINNFATAPQAGAWRFVIFDATPLVKNNSNIDCQGGADVQMAAGDVALVYSDTTTLVRFAMFLNSSSGFRPGALATKSANIAADSVVIMDSADSSKPKTTTFTNLVIDGGTF